MSELIGNKQVRQILSRLVASGRVPNALLFTGPEGVGKKQFALELARSLVCRGPNVHQACGHCAACSRVGEFAIPKFEKGQESDHVFFSQHPDVGIVVPFNRNLRVGAIRALEREAHFRPYEADTRVFIVEDADKKKALDRFPRAVFALMRLPVTWRVLVGYDAKGNGTSETSTSMPARSRAPQHSAFVASA